MSDDPAPTEIATTKEWRDDMVAARNAKRPKMTQGELGVKVGLPVATAQAMISQIETGSVHASKFVLPICKVLRIPPPMHYISADQRRWSKLGHQLEAANPAQFAQVMGLIESMLANAPEPAAPTRAIGRASISTPIVALRDPDALPFERPRRTPKKKKQKP